jgi:transcriptional regulator with GAF, ATPase, and Fis domain
MTSADSPADCAADTNACPEKHRALLAVSEAIVSHHDLGVLFHGLAVRLHHVVCFDFLALLLYDAATETVRQHILESDEPAPPSPSNTPIDSAPAETVLRTQQPVIVSSAEEQKQWPGLVKETCSYGIESLCELPLTIARRKPGTLVFASKQRAAYDPRELCFLQLVANQVAVATRTPWPFRRSNRSRTSSPWKKLTLSVQQDD